MEPMSKIVADCLQPDGGASVTQRDLVIASLLKCPHSGKKGKGKK